MKVAITGATGVIGRAAVATLVAAGHDVRVMMPLYPHVRQQFDAVPDSQAELPMPGGPLQLYDPAESGGEEKAE